MAGQGVDGSVVIQILADDSNFRQSINNLGNTSINIGAIIAQSLSASTAQSAQNINALTQSISQLGTSFDNTISRMSSDLSYTFARGINQLGNQFNDLSNSIRNAGDSTVNSFGNNSPARNAITGFADTISVAFGNLLSDAIEKVAEKAVQLSQDIIQAGISFESAFAGVMKTVDETANTSYADLSDKIRDMSKTIPSTVEEISAVAEAAGQLGISTESVLDFTRVMIDMGNSTNLVAEEAASELAKFANITKMDPSEYKKLGATIVDLGNNFATTERDIVNMSQRLAATASSAGINEQGILALSTALSSVGIEAEAGGTAMSTFIKKIQVAVETGSGQLDQFAKVAGMTSEEFAKLFKSDGVQAIDAFLRGLNRIDSEGGSAIVTLQDMGIKETRLSNAIMALAGSGDMLTRTIETSNTAWEEGTALAEEAEKRYETTESQLQILKNAINDFYISLSESIQTGFDVAPISEYVNALNDAFKEGGFYGLLDEAQELFGISDSTISAFKGLAEQLPDLLDAAAGAFLTFIHSVEEVSGEIFEKFVDQILPLLIDGLNWIADNGDAVNEIIRIFLGMWVGSKISEGVTQVTNLATAIQTSGVAAGIAASGINLYLLAIEAAAAVGMILAGWIDNAADMIGYEGEIKEAYNEANKEIVEQTNLLREQSNSTDPLQRAEAYEQAKRDIDDFTQQLENNKDRIKEIEAEIAENEEQGIFVDALYQELDGLEEQNIFLEAALTDRRHIIDQYYNDLANNGDGQTYQGIGDTPNLFLYGLDPEAEKNADTTPEVNPDVKATEEATTQFMEEEEAKRLHFEAEMAKERGEITEEEYYNRIETITKSLDTESSLYQQYSKEVAKGRRKLSEDAEKQAAKDQQELERAQEEIYKSAKNTVKNELKEVQKDLTSLSTEFEKTYDKIVKSRDKYKERLMGESIFSVITKKDKETGKVTTTYTIKNIDDYLKKQEEYANGIAALENRGLAKGLIDELEGMDKDQALVFIKQLNKMSDEQFNNINDSYKKLDDTTSQLADKRYQDDLDNLESGYIAEVKALFDGLSPDLKKAGMDSASAYIEGFSLSFNKEDKAFDQLDKSIDGLADDINTKLSENAVDLSGTIEGIVRDSGVGDELVDNIVQSINNQDDKISSALETVFQNTGVDMQIKADVENSAAVSSANGYRAAEIIYASQPAAPASTATSGGATASPAQKLDINCRLSTYDGRNLAVFVNDEIEKIKIEGGG